MHRHVFREALVWMEIHGNVPAIVEHWHALLAERRAHGAAQHIDGEEPGDNVGNLAHPSTPQTPGAEPPFGRRRRRRRRRRRQTPQA
jgi:hypothetical protein